jgi:hypothetical protein
VIYGRLLQRAARCRYLVVPANVGLLYIHRLFQPATAELLSSRRLAASNDILNGSGIHRICSAKSHHLPVPCNIERAFPASDCGGARGALTHQLPLYNVFRGNDRLMNLNICVALFAGAGEDTPVGVVVAGLLNPAISLLRSASSRAGRNCGLERLCRTVRKRPSAPRRLCCSM